MRQLIPVLLVLGVSTAQAKEFLQTKDFSGARVRVQGSGIIMGTGYSPISKSYAYTRKIENNQARCLLEKEYKTKGGLPFQMKGSWSFEQPDVYPEDLDHAGLFPMSFKLKSGSGDEVSLICVSKVPDKDAVRYTGQVAFTSYYLLLQSKGFAVTLKRDQKDQDQATKPVAGVAKDEVKRMSAVVSLIGRLNKEKVNVQLDKIIDQEQPKNHQFSGNITPLADREDDKRFWVSEPTDEYGEELDQPRDGGGAQN